MKSLVRDSAEKVKMSDDRKGPWTGRQTVVSSSFAEEGSEKDERDQPYEEKNEVLMKMPHTGVEWQRVLMKFKEYV